MEQQDMSDSKPPSTEPEIIAPGANWQRAPRIWVSTGQHGAVRVQITRRGDRAGAAMAGVAADAITPAT